MFAPAQLRGPRLVCGPFAAKHLNVGAWHGWVARGRMQAWRDKAVFAKAATCVSIAGLLVVAGLWSHLPSYEVVVRCIVTAGAMVVMSQAFHARRDAVATRFAK